MRLRFRLVESKEDIQKFVDKFGQETYNDFTRLKDRVKRVEIEGKAVSLDILYHVKNTSEKEMFDILKRAENREYKQEGESQQVDVEGKLVPSPTNTKKVVYKGKDGIVYFITDVEDMIDVSSDRYGNVIGNWCIAGRYNTDGKVKISQAKEFFYDYMKGNNLDGYYVWVTEAGKKYCILYDNNGIYSIWDEDDNQVNINVLTDDIGELFGIVSLEDDSLRVEDITLLSVEEAEELPEKVREFYEWWWLRSPGDDSDSAAIVYYEDGYIDDDGGYVSCIDNAVRPALFISNLKSLRLKPYQRIKFKGIEWIVIFDNMILCNDISFRRYYFNKTVEQGNNYETSDIKEYIHKKAREFGIL